MITAIKYHHLEIKIIMYALKIITKNQIKYIAVHKNIRKVSIKKYYQTCFQFMKIRINL